MNKLIVFILLLNTLRWCSPLRTGPEGAARVLAWNLNHFGTQLLQELSYSEIENLVFSPASIESALVMLYEGSDNVTRDEIKDTLLLPDDPDVTREGYSELLRSIEKCVGENEAYHANKMFLDDQFQPYEDYVMTLNMYYHTGVQTVDFDDAADASEQINRFVSTTTRGEIADIVSPGSIGGNSRMLLVNAVYFKGLWEKPFNRRSTYRGSFNGYNSQPLAVDMMNQVGIFNYTYIQRLGSEILEMSYEGGETSLLIFLPDGLSDADHILSLLSQVPIEWIMSELQPMHVNITLPRFRVERGLQLVNPLKQLGIVEAFRTSADFSRIAPDPLYVTDIVHKAMLEVNEEGTIAAASTGTAFMPYSIPLDFYVDRPFVFLLMAKDPITTLFLGKVTNPEQ